MRELSLKKGKGLSQVTQLVRGKGSSEPQARAHSPYTMLPFPLLVNPLLPPAFLGVGSSSRQQGPSFMGASLTMYSDGFTHVSLSH